MYKVDDIMTLTGKSYKETITKIVEALPKFNTGGGKKANVTESEFKVISSHLNIEVGDEYVRKTPDSNIKIVPNNIVQRVVDNKEVIDNFKIFEAEELNKSDIYKTVRFLSDMKYDEALSILNETTSYKLDFGHEEFHNKKLLKYILNEMCFAFVPVNMPKRNREVIDAIVPFSFLSNDFIGRIIVFNESKSYHIFM